MAGKFLTVVKKNKGNKEKGASLLEYALLAALVAIAAIGGMTFLGGQIDTSFSNIANAMP